MKHTKESTLNMLIDRKIEDEKIIKQLTEQRAERDAEREEYLDSAVRDKTTILEQAAQISHLKRQLDESMHDKDKIEKMERELERIPKLQRRTRELNNANVDLKAQLAERDAEFVKLTELLDSAVNDYHESKRQNRELRDALKAIRRSSSCYLKFEAEMPRGVVDTIDRIADKALQGQES